MGAMLELDRDSNNSQTSPDRVPTLNDLIYEAQGFKSVKLYPDEGMCAPLREYWYLY